MPVYFFYSYSQSFWRGAREGRRNVFTCWDFSWDVCLQGKIKAQRWPLMSFHLENSAWVKRGWLEHKSMKRKVFVFLCLVYAPHGDLRVAVFQEHNYHTQRFKLDMRLQQQGSCQMLPCSCIKSEPDSSPPPSLHSVSVSGQWVRRTWF